MRRHKQLRGFFFSVGTVIVVVIGSAVRTMSGGLPASYILDNFEAPIRVVQSAEQDPRHRYLWNLYTDNGVAGESLTDLVTAEHHDGSQSLHSRFDQSLAGVPQGSIYLSNWQFYFYPYTIGVPGFSPDGWHYMREFVTDPSQYTIGRVNRLKFWIKIPAGTYFPTIGYHNFEFGTFHREIADDYRSAESNNWHFYHFANLPYSGQWHQVVIDTHPQHQRGTGGTTEPGDRRALSTATPNYTYFDLLTAFYLDFPYNTATQGWPGPVDLFVDGFEAYEETRAENVYQVATINAVYVPNTKTIRVGWNHERGNATTRHDVRYSFSDILASGWDAAMPAPGGTVVPVDGYNTVMEYVTSSIDVSGHSVVYVAVRPQGATLFRQIAIPVGGTTSIAPPTNLTVK